MKRSDRNWTIVQILYRDPCPVTADHPAGWEHRVEKYVVDTPLKSEAQEIVERWLDDFPSQRENLHKVHYYPRNYVDMADDLRARGRVISPP